MDFVLKRCLPVVFDWMPAFSYMLWPIKWEKPCSEGVPSKKILTFWTGDKCSFFLDFLIYVIDEEVYLQARSLTTIDFNDKYHAYRIEINQQTLEFIHINNIRVPPCLFVNKNGDYYVALRYDV